MSEQDHDALIGSYIGFNSGTGCSFTAVVRGSSMGGVLTLVIVQSQGYPANSHYAVRRALTLTHKSVIGLLTKYSKNNDGSPRWHKLSALEALARSDELGTVVVAVND